MTASTVMMPAYVILVTDEEDQSDGTPQLCVDFFRNLKVVLVIQTLNISAIAGPPPNGCSTADANDFDQEAVQQLAVSFVRSVPLIGVTSSSLEPGCLQCTSSVPRLGNNQLSESSITVRVCDADSNGNPINCRDIPLDGSNGWTFDAATNSIVFNGSSIPGQARSSRSRMRQFATSSERASRGRICSGNVQRPSRLGSLQDQSPPLSNFLSSSNQPTVYAP